MAVKSRNSGDSERIEISDGDFRSEVVVGRGLLERAGEFLAAKGRRCALIADENSARLFGETLNASLCAAGIAPVLITIPNGERAKSLTQVERVCSEMIAAGLDRGSFVVGVGGGVVGDLAGFVAAIFQRGIPHTQVPTTLLAMVDSAIGGKTGVNLDAGKNLVGAVHQPFLILADLVALDSLPPHQLRQGIAEIIKHGVIRDAAMLAQLRAGDFEMGALIRRNIAIKAAIVAQDAREISGQRALLNFGHTIGHGLERASDFRLPHGDCIALGMIAACRISEKRAGLSSAETASLVELLTKFELPTALEREIPQAKIIEAIAHDKKFASGQIRFVLTPRFGEAFVSSEVTMAEIAAEIARLA